MTIREVAQQLGISTYTIRFYEKSGLLPRIRRTAGGIRFFCANDIAFLHFLMELKKTGMSLEDIADFTHDGCILEQLQQGDIPTQAVEKRMDLLQHQQERLCEQRSNLDHLIDTVAQKLQLYASYLHAHAEKKQ